MIERKGKKEGYGSLTFGYVKEKEGGSLTYVLADPLLKPYSMFLSHFSIRPGLTIKLNEKKLIK